MSGKGKNRTVIDMSCTECRDRNYSTEKSRRNDPNRLEFKKYCPKCRAHRLYREVR